MDEEEPNHPVFSYSEEGEEENPAVNDELENLSDDIRRKHDSKTSYGRANAGGAIGFRGGPDVLNENDKIQLAMRTSEATSGPGAVLHAPDENSTSRVKRTQSTQLAFFSLFRRDPDGCRGPARHKEDDKSRKNDFDNTNSVEQEPLDDLNSRMNIFKRHNDGLEGTEEQKRKRRRTIFILFGVVGLLVIVSVVVGVVMGMGGQGKSPTTADDADVDFVESVVECLAAGVEYEASERFTRIQSTIVSEIAGMNTTIELPGTAARAALCWLADLDIAEFSTSEASPRGIIQRFALGLIYYHFVLGVDSEPGSKLVTSNWLQAVHECRWDYVDCAGESVGEVVELRMSSLLLSGAMPSELGLLTTLSTLELGANFLVGTMPSELWTMERLETFSVQANRMSGTLSSQVRQLSRLRSFDVSLNAFSGTIPDLGDFPTLERFDVFSNPLIVGMIPNLEGATNLECLGWFGLNLSGSIPSFLGSLTKLTHLDIHALSLTGSIPTEIGMLTELHTLIVRALSISGTIPTELGQLVHLIELDLSHNKELSGSAPSEIGRLTNLETLSLDGNNWSYLPSEVCLLPHLVEVCPTCSSGCPAA